MASLSVSKPFTAAAARSNTIVAVTCRLAATTVSLISSVATNCWASLTLNTSCFRVSKLSTVPAIVKTGSSTKASVAPGLAGGEDGGKGGGGGVGGGWVGGEGGGDIGGGG